MPVLKNTRHEKFAQLRASGTTETAAAKGAGYSPKTARVQGSALLTNPNICNRISELQKACADEAIMDITERKKILSEIGRGNLVDYQKAGKDKQARIVFDKSSPNPRAVQELTEHIETGGRGKKGDIRIRKIKLHGPIGAIQELNKMDGAHAPARSQVDISGEITDGHQESVADRVAARTAEYVKGVRHAKTKAKRKPTKRKG